MRNANARSLDSFLDFGEGYGGIPKSVNGGLRGPAASVGSSIWANNSYRSPKDLDRLQSPSPSRSPYVNQQGRQFQGTHTQEDETKKGEHVPTAAEEKHYFYKEDTRRRHELGLLPGPSPLSNNSSGVHKVLPSEDIKKYAPAKVGGSDDHPQEPENVEPTTKIQGNVVCADSSAWQAMIHTDVIDNEGPERSSRFILDFNASEGGSDVLRIRIDVGRIIDVKTTAGAMDGTGLQYFILLHRDAILHGSKSDGIQDLPDQSSKVLHVSGVRCYEDARNFFAELLILAQFLAQGGQM